MASGKVHLQPSCKPPLGIGKDYKVTLEPSLPQDERPQLSKLVFTGDMLQPFVEKKTQTKHPGTNWKSLTTSGKRNSTVQERWRAWLPSWCVYSTRHVLHAMLWVPRWSRHVQVEGQGKVPPLWLQIHVPAMKHLMQHCAHSVENNRRLKMYS